MMDMALFKLQNMTYPTEEIKLSAKVVERVSNQAWSEGPQWYQFAVEQLRVRLSWVRNSVPAVTALIGKISSFQNGLKTVQKLDSDLSRSFGVQSRCTERISTNRGQGEDTPGMACPGLLEIRWSRGNILFLGFWVQNKLRNLLSGLPNHNRLSQRRGFSLPFSNFGYGKCSGCAMSDLKELGSEDHSDFPQPPGGNWDSVQTKGKQATFITNPLYRPKGPEATSMKIKEKAIVGGQSSAGI